MRSKNGCWDVPNLQLLSGETIPITEAQWEKLQTLMPTINHHQKLVFGDHKITRGDILGIAAPERPVFGQKAPPAPKPRPKPRPKPTAPDKSLHTLFEEQGLNMGWYKKRK